MMQQSFANQRKEVPGQGLKNKYADVPSRIAGNKPASQGRPPVTHRKSNSKPTTASSKLPDSLVMPLIKQHYRRFAELI